MVQYVPSAKPECNGFWVKDVLDIELSSLQITLRFECRGIRIHLWVMQNAPISESSSAESLTREELEIRHVPRIHHNHTMLWDSIALVFVLLVV